MKTIYKVKLAIEDSQFISFQQPAQVLSVQVQNEVPCLWVMVDTEQPFFNYEISTFGTGNPIPKDFNGTFIGTYQLRNGRFVGHVFISSYQK